MIELYHERRIDGSGMTDHMGIYEGELTKTSNIETASLDTDDMPTLTYEAWCKRERFDPLTHRYLPDEGEVIALTDEGDRPDERTI